MNALEKRAAVLGLQAAGFAPRQAKAVVEQIDYAEYRARAARQQAQIRWLFAFNTALLLLTAARLYGLI